MIKWKCEICGSEFENYQAQGFNHKIYCPLCYFKELYKREKQENQQLKKQKNELEKENNELQKAYELIDKSMYEFMKQKDDVVEYINKNWYSKNTIDINEIVIGDWRIDILRMLGEIDNE